MVDQDSPKKITPPMFLLRFHCNCYNCWTNKFLRYTKASIFDIRTVSSGHEYRGENMITTGAVLSTMRVFLEATKRATMNEFPHGSKSEAVQLGFIWFSCILLGSHSPTPQPEDFCFILMVGGGQDGVPLFGSLNVLIIIWYIVKAWV